MVPVLVLGVQIQRLQRGVVGQPQREGVAGGVGRAVRAQAGGVKGQFSEGTWRLATLGTSSVYAVPQDIGPMMLYYRSDLFSRWA